eukprot:scaffold7738_cov133-Cylindrotheca_fusiformis.AAC.19
MGLSAGVCKRPVPDAHTQRNVLLAVTGSVAAIKSPEIAVRLALDYGVKVKVLLTAGGKNFWDKAHDYNPEFWKSLMSQVDEGNISVIRKPWKKLMKQSNDIESDDEWKGWNKLGDPVLHIDLRDWADLLIIAPLSAHTLAKLANGLCDDTLSCVVRAWDFGNGIRPPKPILLAPAMNTAMWEHPLTQPQLQTIRGFWNICKYPTNGISIVEPQAKKLACGEIGNGALASVNDILDAVAAHTLKETGDITNSDPSSVAAATDSNEERSEKKDKHK